MRLRRRHYRDYRYYRREEPEAMKNFGLMEFFKKIVWEGLLLSIFRLAKHHFVLQSQMPRSNVIIDYFALAIILTALGWCFKFWYGMAGIIGFELVALGLGLLRKHNYKVRMARMFYVSDEKLAYYRQQAQTNSQTVKRQRRHRRKTVASTAPSKSGIPDFAQMDATQLSHWISENPDMVRVASKPNS